LNFTNHYIMFDSGSPPALMTVVDSTGNVAGVDQEMPVNSVGYGTTISEITGSYVQEMNIGPDEGATSVQPAPTTGWLVYIQDQPAQTYTVNLSGTKSGVAYLTVGGGYYNSTNTIHFSKQSFLVTPGVTRTVEVSYDPTAASLTITPIVNSSDLLQDTQAACKLGDIDPAEACEVLEAIALEVEKSITQGNANAEAIELNLYLLVLNQLHNWGNAGSIQNWGNFNGYSECLPLCNKGLSGINFFAKNPTYSALELDAQTLLNALPNQGISQGGGNQGGGNQGGNQGGQGNQGGSNQDGQGNNGGSNQGGGNQGYGQGSNGNQGSGGNQGGQGNQGGGNQGNH
jgi:hypothetical protein